jgi:dihydrofolate reductase
MTVSIVAALSTNNVIGRNNRLPWHVSADLKRFKSLTVGHHLLIGRKTFESLDRPLPGRTIVVITRDRNFAADGVLTAPSVERAIELARLDPEVFIGGGAQIFEQTMHRADRMYLTRIHTEIEGDAFFPEFDDVTEWILVDVEHHEADEKNDYPYSFLTYERGAVLA